MKAIIVKLTCATFLQRHAINDLRWPQQGPLSSGSRHRNPERRRLHPSQYSCIAPVQNMHRMQRFASHLQCLLWLCWSVKAAAAPSVNSEVVSLQMQIERQRDREERWCATAKRQRGPSPLNSGRGQGAEVLGASNCAVTLDQQFLWAKSSKKIMTSDLRQQGFHAVCHDLKSTLFMCRGQQKIWQPCCQGLNVKKKWRRDWWMMRLKMTLFRGVCKILFVCTSLQPTQWLTPETPCNNDIKLLLQI